jgi:DNA-binding response OmpR family regulator
MFISVNNALEDKIKGLRLGADDYLVKPIDSTELLLRTEALLSRIKPLQDHERSTNIKFLDFQINPETRLLQCNDQELALGFAEHQLLLLMIGQQGNVCSRRQVANAVYASPEGASDRAIDKLVSRLRQKLTKIGGSAEFIITQRGKGYLLVSQV